MWVVTSDISLEALKLKLPAHCRVVGCDINREAVTLAHRCFPGASFLAARAEALPFASASFDTLLPEASSRRWTFPKPYRSSIEF